MNKEIPTISITGVDGAGKDTARRAAMPMLPETLNMLYIGKPALIIRGSEEVPVQQGITRTLDHLHEVADRTGNRAMISAVNAMTVMFMWGFQEKYWSRVVQPDLVLSIRDGYADPAAYAPFYMPGTLGRLSIPGRIQAMHILHHAPFRNRTVFLEIKPNMAVERINQRFRREQTSPTKDRPAKWIHEHENLAGITGIRNEFLRVLDYLEIKHGTEVVKIDAGQRPEVVAVATAAAISKMIRD